MSFDPEILRHTMRAWTTGVAILLSTHQEKTYGITINSFTSLSIEPPFITVVLRRSSFVHDLVSRSGMFSVNILAASQQELAENFAGKLHAEDRMKTVALEFLPAGSVVLQECLAWLDCRVRQTVEVGQNTLFIAEVIAAQVYSTEDPLVYHNRAYHRLA